MLFYAQLGVAFMATVGLYYLGLVLLRIPTRQAERSFRATVMQKKTPQEVLYGSFVAPLIAPVAAIMPISYERQVEMQAELRQVGIRLSTSEYYARGLILAIYSIPLIFVVPLLGLSSAFMVATALIPIIVFFHLTTEHSDMLRDKRNKIRRLLPSFVRSILYSLADKEDSTGDEVIGRANLVAIFSNYLKVCPEVIYYDVALLITEMQSLSVETGIRRFGERLSLPTVTYLCDILIGISKGQPHSDALKVLAIDIDNQGREAIRDELQKRPGEMRRATVALVFLAMGIVMYVLVADLIGSWGYFGS